MTEPTPTAATPSIIGRYLRVAGDQDAEALASCFTGTGTVVDEGITYRGHDEIVGWRKQLEGKWEYTSKVTQAEAVDGHRFLVDVHLEGNFPGGDADLRYTFSLDGDELTALTIE
jgi:hypothetical protein